MQHALQKIVAAANPQNTPLYKLALPTSPRLKFSTKVCIISNMNLNQEPIIVSDKEILGGTPVFAGTRVPFRNLIDYLEAGDSIDLFLYDFPSVSREQVIAALEAAKETLLGQVA